MKKTINISAINTFIIILLIFSCSSSLDQGISSNTLNGSYAKLLTVGDYLYAINESEITTFDITKEDEPIEIDMQMVGFKIENIFHSEGILFIGSQEALHIFIIENNGVPLRKSQTSYFENEFVTSCDPVIVSKNLAYVTLSTVDISNSPCWRSVQINELRIYDIENLEKPSLLSTTSMETPKGLGIDDQYLFVCLENTGLQILNIQDPSNPVIISKLTGFPSYDVIANDGLLMIVCPDEIRQYDYTDISDIQFLSSIDI